MKKNIEIITIYGTRLVLPNLNFWEMMGETFDNSWGDYHDYDDEGGGEGTNNVEKVKTPQNIEKCYALALKSVPSASAFIVPRTRINGNVSESYEFGRWIPEYFSVTTWLEDYWTAYGLQAGGQAIAGRLAGEKFFKGNLYVIGVGQLIGMNVAFSRDYANYLDQYYSKSEQSTMSKYNLIFSKCVTSTRTERPPKRDERESKFYKYSGNSRGM